ncbi:MAG TPA: type II toxin-antitoxin system VapC family toxin [Candidatus Lokiarchaeia archaeon]
MKGIDANIIVYALNSDLPEHLYCKGLLEEVARGIEPIAIPNIVLIESYHALVYKYKFNSIEVKEKLTAILESENVNVFDITTSTILYTFEIASHYYTGGRDSLIAASLLENNIKVLYSHDGAFDSIKEIKRLDPIKDNIE